MNAQLFEDRDWKGMNVELAHVVWSVSHLKERAQISPDLDFLTTVTCSLCIPGRSSGSTINVTTKPLHCIFRSNDIGGMSQYGFPKPKCEVKEGMTRRYEVC